MGLDLWTSDCDREMSFNNHHLDLGRPSFYLQCPKKKNFLLCISVERVLPSMQYTELHGHNVGKKALPVHSLRTALLVMHPEENYFTLVQVCS